MIIDTLAAQLYDRLLDVDPYTYRLIPELAQSWESLTTRHLPFHLRKDVPFQKTGGFSPTRKNECDDVVFSFQRIIDPNNHYHAVNGEEYPYIRQFAVCKAIKSIKKLDDSTVEFRLNNPDASFLWHLATHYAPCFQRICGQSAKSRYEEEIDRQPVAWPVPARRVSHRPIRATDAHGSYWKAHRHGAGGDRHGRRRTGRLSKL